MSLKKKDKTENRTEIIAGRYTKKEKESIEKKAEMAGCKVSEYVRKVILNHKISSLSDKKMIFELNKIGVNINQIAKEIHIYRDDINIKNSLKRLESLLNDIDNITNKVR